MTRFLYDRPDSPSSGPSYSTVEDISFYIVAGILIGVISVIALILGLYYFVKWAKRKWNKVDPAKEMEEDEEDEENVKGITERGLVSKI